MNAIDPNIEAVLNRLADGIASDADQQCLSDWLGSGPDARKAYREFMALHSALHWDYVAAAAPDPSPSPQIAGVRAPLLGWIVTFVAGAIVAALAAWAVFNWKNDDLPGGVVSPDTPSAESIAALLVNEASAEFAAGREPDGVRFEPGDYELVNGMIHLRFANGADMVLSGPARLQIQDSQHTRLLYGKVRVTAPPSAKGFTVSTGSADYIDLGTEFGLQVDRESGASDLYVFDGQVNVADPDSGKILSEIGGGQSSRMIDGSIVRAPELEEGRFPTSGSIGFRRWQQSEESMRQSRGMLAFFPFRKKDDSSVLANESDAAAIKDGRIVGAKWTTGRWPGKDALLFDSDSDHVGLEISGEYSELSVAAWIKADRFDFVFNAILNSDGYDLGNIHFQVTRQGYPRGGVIVNGKFQDNVTSQPVPLGEWVHVASVLDARERTQQIYVNGKLSRERKWESDEILRPGSCRLGNWLSAPKVGAERRAFRGRVDELAIWKRVLSEAEVGRLFEAGRPGMMLD